MSLLRQARTAAAETDRWRRSQRASRRFAAWGGLAGAALGLGLFAPAQWLAHALQQATDGRLLLADARGSVWDGSATLVLTGGPGSQDAATLPGRLHWALRPHWQGLRLRASQACCLNGELALLLQPGWGGYTLALAPVDVLASANAANAASPGNSAIPARPLGQWPASWLSGLGTPWNTLQPGGVLQLASPGFSVQSVQGRLRLQGALALDLLGMSSRVSTLPTLGSYRLSLQGQASAATASATAAANAITPANAITTATGGDTTQVQLTTLDGALRLSGSGQWAGGKLRFRGEAQAAEGQAPALANLLNIIGRRQGALSVISIG